MPEEVFVLPFEWVDNFEVSQTFPNICESLATVDWLGFGVLKKIRWRLKGNLKGKKDLPEPRILSVAPEISMHRRGDCP